MSDDFDPTDPDDFDPTDLGFEPPAEYGEGSDEGGLADGPFEESFGSGSFSDGFDDGAFAFDAPDPEDWSAVDRQIEFNEDLERARQKAAAKGAAAAELDDGSWMYRISWDELPVTCPYEQLAFAGWTPTPLEDLPGDGEFGDGGEPAADVVHDALWTLLYRCADHGVFFGSTDHLSDRGLYELLLTDLLWSYGPCPPPEAGFNQHFDCAEDGDFELYLTYYADDSDREHWAAEFGDELPPRKAKPYDRDARLPRPADEDEPGD